MQRKGSAVGLHHICALARVCLYVVSGRAPTRRLPPTSPSLAGWPALVLLLQFPVLEAPLGWRSGLVGATL